MKEMYKGKVNSPATLLVETIDSSVTSIKVADGTVFPEGPNVAVIGTDGNAETIKYDSINGNILVGCVRGFQGKASVWDKDTIIARNFTEYDLDVIQENILELNKKQLKDFKEDSTHRTVTDSEKEKWNKKVDQSQITGDVNTTGSDKVWNVDVIKKQLSDKVPIEQGKTLSSNDFTDDLKNKLENIEDGANKITKLSQLTNDKTYKTESEIQAMINNSTKLKKEVVTSLPYTGKEDIIYLLKNKNDNNNFYTEYLWISDKWEIIGDTKVDLTAYAKKTDIKTKLSEMTEDSTHRTLTDVEKTKITNIPPSPKYTDTVTSINGKTGAISKNDIVALGIPSKDTTYSAATQSYTGLMSAADKKRLDNIKEQVPLTETQYSALSSVQQNDKTKIYFIRKS